MNGRLAGNVHHEGYRRITISGVQYQAHRLAWMWVFGSEPNDQIDHRDGDRLNNRIANLREATKDENGRNRKLHKNNSSGFKGVRWHRKNQKWRAVIKVNNRDIALGYFDEPFGAAIAYDIAAKKYFGAFARLNNLWETL